MKYHIELSGEDVLLILRWLETTGQDTLAVRVRDQYIAQLKAIDEALEQAQKTKPKEGFDKFFRGLSK